MIGALLGAYHEDDSGSLRALLPLAGRTLLEYQVRCVAAAGAAPIVVIVERVPQMLQDAFERLRVDGLTIIAASDVQDAVSRFEAGAMILMVADGVAPPAELVVALAEEPEPAVATVPDTEGNAPFERIDAQARWAGVALVDSRNLGSTAAILGDWDLQSTLLRKTLQEGAIRLPVSEESAPLFAERADQLADFQRTLVAASRGARSDWASRYVLPPLEEIVTERLMPTSIRPQWLIWLALVLTLMGAVAFARGLLGAGLVFLLLSTPLDIVASRLASLRLQPLSNRMATRRALWPLAGVALLALAWWESRHVPGWGALVTAAATLAFAEAARIEKLGVAAGSEIWLLSRRNAIFAAIPFAIAGTWTAFLIALLIYAAVSFFLVQHVRHSSAELTRS
jgi:hypothetical protein